MQRKVLNAAAPGSHTDEAIQVEVTLPVRQRGGGGGKEPKDETRSTGARPRIPRITRLMALAIKFQGMVDSGEVHDYADIARLGHVTRARLTQIMNLLLLAPDIQEEIIEMGRMARESNHVERHVRSVVKSVLWDAQRRAWAATSS